MSVELITVIVTIIGVGTGLAGLIVTGQNSLRREMREHRAENQAEFKAQREENQAEFKAQREENQAEFKAVRAEIGGLREQISALQERMARVEGVLDGLLREAFIGRRPAPVEAQAVAEDPGPYDKT